MKANKNLCLMLKCEILFKYCCLTWCKRWSYFRIFINICGEKMGSDKLILLISVICRLKQTPKVTAQTSIDWVLDETVGLWLDSNDDSVWSRSIWLVRNPFTFSSHLYIEKITDAEKNVNTFYSSNVLRCSQEMLKHYNTFVIWGVGVETEHKIAHNICLKLYL